MISKAEIIRRSAKEFLAYGETKELGEHFLKNADTYAAFLDESKDIEMTADNYNEQIALILAKYPGVKADKLPTIWALLIVYLLRHPEIAKENER